MITPQKPIHYEKYVFKKWQPHDANTIVETPVSLTVNGQVWLTFMCTPIDLEASYTPPDLGVGNVATTYTYNQDRQLTQVTRPDGQTLTLDYDPTKGRLTTLTAPAATVQAIRALRERATDVLSLQEIHAGATA